MHRRWLCPREKPAAGLAGSSVCGSARSACRTMGNAFYSRFSPVSPHLKRIQKILLNYKPASQHSSFHSELLQSHDRFINEDVRGEHPQKSPRQVRPCAGTSSASSNASVSTQFCSLSGWLCPTPPLVPTTDVPRCGPASSGAGSPLDVTLWSTLRRAKVAQVTLTGSGGDSKLGPSDPKSHTLCGVTRFHFVYVP